MKLNLISTSARAGAVLALAGTLLLAAPAHAAVAGYTTQAAYAAATASSVDVQTVNFEAVPSGTTFASGTGTGGLSFAYNIPGATMVVGSLFNTTSGTRYLGLNNGDLSFYLGDAFSINFNRGVNAAGLYVITGSGVIAGDFRLNAATGSVSNSATPDRVLSDGSTAYFLGLFENSPGVTFTSVTLSSSSGPLITFNVDDITSAVPEPATVLLLLGGLAIVGAQAQRRRL